MQKLLLFLVSALMVMGIPAAGANWRIAACKQVAVVALQAATNSGTPTGIAAGAQGVVAAHWRRNQAALESAYRKQRFNDRMSDPRQ